MASPERDQASARSPLSSSTLLKRGTALAILLALVAGWITYRQTSNGESEEPIRVEDFLSSEAEPVIPAGTATIKIGDELPDVVLPRIGGSALSLADLSGIPTVINFWASNCTPCVAEMPLLERVHQQLGDTVQFVGINTLEGADAATAMIKKTGVTYQQAQDPLGDVLALFGGTKLPMTVVVSATGVVTALLPGALKNEQELIDLIAT